jgi:TPR repeat protein
MGGTYAYGTGVTRDYDAALKWFTLAAQQGVAGSKYNIGTMHENG